MAHCGILWYSVAYAGMVRYGPIWFDGRYLRYLRRKVAGGGLMVGKTLTQHAGAIAFHNCSSEDRGAEPQTELVEFWTFGRLDGVWTELTRETEGIVLELAGSQKSEGKMKG